MKYDGEESLPQISEEEFGRLRSTAKGYTICILKAGPRYEPPGPNIHEGVTAIIWQHGKRNAALQKAGLMPIICPITQSAQIRGVCIFDLPPDEAAKVMDEDPGVKAAVFTYELFSCRSFPGSALP